MLYPFAVFRKAAEIVKRESSRAEKAARVENRRRAEEERQKLEALEAPAGFTNQSEESSSELEDEGHPVTDDKDPGDHRTNEEIELEAEQLRLEASEQLRKEDAKTKSEYWR